MISINELKKKQCAFCVHNDICKYRLLVTLAISDMEEAFENRCENLPVKMKIQCDKFASGSPVVYRKRFGRCD